MCNATTIYWASQNESRKKNKKANTDVRFLLGHTVLVTDKFSDGQSTNKFTE